MSRKQKKTLLRMIAAAVLCIVAALLPLEGTWKALAFAVPYLIVGYDVLWGAARNIGHGQVFDEKFLMAVATLGAFAIREYPEAAAVMLFLPAGRVVPVHRRGAQPQIHRNAYGHSTGQRHCPAGRRRD